MRSILRKAQWISCTLAVLLSTVSPSQPRSWSRTVTNPAQDYLLINDNRGNGEVVWVYWVAPPLMPPSGQASREFLDKYIIIGVTHAHTSREGTYTFDRPATLEVSNGSGEPLLSLDMDTMPPAVVGTLAVLKTAVSRSLGAFGQGMQWFAFANGSVHACTKGGLSVLFANEKYTYDTPIPGCPTP